MERWERSYRRGRDVPANPSFSSSLLDAIYRSIDEDATSTHLDGGGAQRGQLNGGAPHSVKKHHYSGDHKPSERFFAAAAAAAVVEKKKTTTTTTSEKVVLRRKLAATDAEYEHLNQHRRQHHHQQRDRFFNSTSSSSESSYGGFSSSEAESVVHSARPKPVRTGALPAPEGKHKPKQEGSIRSRFRASKIYGDLKKAKTPVSPGARLASFINNLFTASGNPKKASISSASAAAMASSAIANHGGEDSTCSSASSYSRSCLSKTPSSRGKGAANGVKRSVRFYPVSIIVDEDCRPCGQKCLSEEDYRRRDLALPPLPPPLPAVRTRESAYLSEEWKRADERKAAALGFRAAEFDKDDDAASCDSSDLFELENLTSIGGGGRYRDELPVYETTFFNTNRAIAQGLIL